MEPSSDDLDEKDAWTYASSKTVSLQANHNKMDVKVLHLHTIPRAKIVLKILHT
jgi:hypothetical protein